MKTPSAGAAGLSLKVKLSVTTAALHLCDVELIGPLRPRSFAPGVG